MKLKWPSFDVEVAAGLEIVGSIEVRTKAGLREDVVQPCGASLCVRVVSVVVVEARKGQPCRWTTSCR